MRLKRLLKHFFIPHRGNAFRPHAFRHKMLSIYSLILAASQLLFGVTLSSGPAINQFDAQTLKQNIIAATNENRLTNSSPYVLESQVLDKAAEAKLADMFAKNYWDHTGPNGETAWDFITNEGYQYKLAGENLAKGYTRSGDVVSAWMASPSHRENLLNSRFREIGVAVGSGYLEGKKTTLIVQIFSEPKTAFASAKTEVLGEKKLSPELSWNNPVSPSRIPYFITWTIIFALILVDGLLIKKLGLHASKSHIFNFRVSLLMALFGLAVLSLAFVAIA